ncbi:MAG: aspartate kinase [Anaerovoracaceae bacterium]
MPIKVQNNLPAVKILTEENVFVITEKRAMTQDIRPLQILILNLMPTKVDTETQLARVLGNTPLQVELELLQTKSHKAMNTSEDHMLAFYKTFDAVRDKYYDGMVITGAPVELLDFEEVEYWEELCEIMDWSKRHVHSTFHICWGAQAGLYYHYGIKKQRLPQKMSGVYLHELEYKNGMLFRGFDDNFYVPHSRNTTVDRADIEAIPQLKIIASSKDAGVYAIKSENGRQIFIMGHSEYDGDTLKKEYLRDKNAGINPTLPCNYFLDDDDTKEPVVRWRSSAHLLYSNWLNYFVYQSTPYDINQIPEETPDLTIEEDANLKVSKFGGSSLADGARFKKVAKIIKSQPERRYIVVSAPGKRFDDDIKITDLLIKCEENAKEGKPVDSFLEEISQRYAEIIKTIKIDFDLENEMQQIKEAIEKGANKGFVISRGEYLNAKIMAKYLGYEFVDAAQGIFFDQEGNFDGEKTNKILSGVLKKYEYAVIPGFYGTMPDGRIKTFTRDGSDLTGSIVSVAVMADLYENWTDVSGLLMADPRIVDDPITVPVITYKELRELSYMGAAVIHEDTVFPVRKVGIPINIKNTNRPKDTGTLIVKNAECYQSNLQISGISGKRGYATIVIEKDKMNEKPELRTKLLKVFMDNGVAIKNILSGLDSLNIIIKEDSITNKEDKLIGDIKKAINPNDISITKGIAMIAIVGRELGSSPTIAVRVLGALANKKINIKLIDHGSEKINIMLGVDEKDYISAIKAIYTGFTGM